MIYHDLWLNWFLVESLSSQYNPETIMALLQTSVAQSEESSEVSSEPF